MTVLGYRAVLRQDYDDVREHFTNAARWPVGAPQAVDGHLRRIHHLCYSLMLWSHRIDDLPPRGQAFLDELRAEALQILPHCLDGYAKTPLLLMRCCIESAVKHAYFWDHQIEYERYGTDDFKLPPRESWDYLGKHPLLKSLQPQWDCNNKLSSCYGQISLHIHGTRSFQEAPLRMLGEIELSPETLQQQLAFLEQAAANINFLLAAIQRGRLERFDDEYRAILLRTMPSEARAALVGITFR